MVNAELWNAIIAAIISIFVVVLSQKVNFIVGRRYGKFVLLIKNHISGGDFLNRNQTIDVTKNLRYNKNQTGYVGSKRESAVHASA